MLQISVCSLTSRNNNTMIILKTLLFILGTAVVSITGAVLRAYPLPLPFEVDGFPEQTPFYQFGIPNYLSSQLAPLSIQYGKSDCDQSKTSHHDEMRYIEPIIFTPEFLNKPGFRTQLKPVEITGAHVQLPPITVPELPTASVLYDNIPQLTLTAIPAKVIGEPALSDKSENVPANPEYLKYLPQIIPEAPLLQPFKIPEVPTNFILQEPTQYDESETLPAQSEEPKGEYAKAIIPEAPVLPPVKLPESANIVFDEPALCDESETIPAKPEEPKVEYLPQIIPEAPLLPRLELPEIPANFIAQEPTLPDIPKGEYLLKIIPEAPVLPPVKLPESANIVFDEPALCDESETIPAKPEEPKVEYLPQIIPEAPLLPRLELPEVSANFIVQEPTLYDESETKPAKPEEPKGEYVIAIIPEAPVFPPFKLPESGNYIVDKSEILPAKLEKPKVEYLPQIIPEAPLLPSFELPEISANFIVEEPARVDESEILPAKPEETKVEYLLAIIPEAPILPPFKLPEISDNALVLPAKPEEPKEDYNPEIMSNAFLFSPRHNSPEVSTNSIVEKSAFYDKSVRILAKPEEAEMFKPTIYVEDSARIPALPTPPLPAEFLEKEELVPCSDSEISSDVPKLFINENSVVPKTTAYVAPSPIVLKAPMQIVIQRSDLSRFGTSEDCLYKYLTDRIIANVLPDRS